MSELSVPWPGVTTTDAGPYNSSTWNDVWLAMSRSGGRLSRVADYDIGVFYGIANALEPASNVTEITVDTGASLVDGLYHENTASVAVPIPASGAGTSRIDVVVVRKNYQQAVTYTPTGGAPTVPPRTARITVIRGVEAAGPVAPSLEQDVTRTTYWDIPIARVQVSNAGALSNFTDLREFVDAGMKRIIVPIDNSQNVTDGTSPLEYGVYGLRTLDNKDSEFIGHFMCPTDYISDMTISLWVIPLGTGDYYGRCRMFWGADGEGPNTHSAGSNLDNNYAVVSVLNNIIIPSSVTGFLQGDYAILMGNRTATSISGDTIDDKCYVNGFVIEYFGWKK